MGGPRGENADMSEATTVRRQVRQELKRRGIYHVPYPGGPYSTPGTPDFLCCVDGHFLGIECKTPRGKVSSMQGAQHEALRRSKGTVIVARSVADLVGYIER